MIKRKWYQYIAAALVVPMIITNIPQKTFALTETTGSKDNISVNSETKAGEVILNPVDFGADPSGKDDSAEAIWDTFQAAQKATEDGASSVVVKFPKGEYHIYKDYSQKREYHTSNTNSTSYPIKSIGMLIEDQKNLTVDGSGSLFMMHGNMMALAVVRSENVKLQNFSWDFMVPTVSEMTVIDAGDSYVDYYIPASCDFEVKGNTIQWNSDKSPYTGEYYWTETGIHNAYSVIANNPEEEMTRAYFTNQGPFVNVTGIEKLDESTVRFTYSSTPEKRKSEGIMNGAVFQLASSAVRETAGAFFWESKDLVAEDITVHSTHGFGWLTQMSHNVTYRRCDFMPREGAGRITTSYADGIHASGASGDFIVEDCDFSNTHDDPINLHGTFTRVEERVDDNTLVLKYIHAQQGGFPQFHVGDEVQFFTRDTLESTDNESKYTVEEVISNPGEDGNNLKTMKIRFKETLPEDLSDKIGNQPKYVAENTTYAPKITIRGCTFKNVNTRGILATSRQPILIENNVFLNMSMATNYFSNDSDEWYESGPIRDLTIRGNTFYIKTVGRASWNDAPAIYFHPVTKGGGLPDSSNPIHKNITIDNNEFYMDTDCVVLAESVENLKFTNNKVMRYYPDVELKLNLENKTLNAGETVPVIFEATGNQNSGTNGRPNTPDSNYDNLFQFKKCKDVVLENNIYDDGLKMSAIDNGGNINIDIKDKDIKLTEEINLPATPAVQNITFASTAPEIASVDNNGNITAKSAGKATIFAYYNWNGTIIQSNHIEVEVTGSGTVPDKPELKIVEDDNKIITANQTQQYTVSGVSGETKVKWTVENPLGGSTSCAEINDEGLLTGKENGVVVIKAIVNGVTASKTAIIQAPAFVLANGMFVRENPATWSAKDNNSITITIEQGDLWQTDNNVKNLFLLDLPSGISGDDMITSVHVDGLPISEPGKWNTGSFLLHKDDDNYVSIGKKSHYNGFAYVKENNAIADEVGEKVTDNNAVSSATLVFVKNGNNIDMFGKPDGVTTWTKLNTITDSTIGNDYKIGFAGWGSGSNKITFSDLKIGKASDYNLSQINNEIFDAEETTTEIVTSKTETTSSQDENKEETETTTEIITETTSSSQDESKEETETTTNEEVQENKESSDNIDLKEETEEESISEEETEINSDNLTDNLIEAVAFYSKEILFQKNILLLENPQAISDFESNLENFLNAVTAIEFVVQNEAPVVSNAVVSPVSTGSTATVTYDYQDNEQQEESNTLYHWILKDTSGKISETFTNKNTFIVRAAGELQCTIYPRDKGGMYGEAVTAKTTVQSGVIDYSLDSVSVNGTVISGFSQDDTEYSVLLPKGLNKMQISYTASDLTSGTTKLLVNNEIVQTNGNDDTVIFDVGDVGSESICKLQRLDENNNVQKEYVIKAHVAKDSNTKLTEMKIDALDFSVSGQIEDTYYIKASENQSSVTLDITTDPNCGSVEVFRNSQREKMNVLGSDNVYTVTLPVIAGLNSFYVEAVGEDGISRKRHIINVTKEASQNANLRSLSVNNNQLEGFSSDKTEYLINTDNKKLSLSAQTEDALASISVTVNGVRTEGGNIANAELKTGLNKVRITVLADDVAARKIYDLQIVCDTEDNDNLLSLSIDDIQISPLFNQDKTEYSAQVYQSEITIRALAQNKKSQVVIKGNGISENITGQELQASIPIYSGQNIIQIEVTAADGVNKKLYIVKVNGNPTVYLSDINWESASVGYGSPQKDLSCAGNRLTLATKENSEDETGSPVTYERGIGGNAAASFVYNLDGKGFNRFTCYVGVDYANYNAEYGSIQFKALLDDVEVFDSGIMEQKTPQKQIDLDITGAKKLELIADQVENNYNDHADWADAKLFLELPVRTDSSVVISNLTNGEITADKMTAKSGETVTLTVLPNEGYQLKEGSLKVNDTVINQENGVYSFVMPNEDVIIKAEFEKASVILNNIKLPESLANGKITTDKTEAQPGETITLTVLPNEGYQLKEGSLKVNDNVINQENGVYSFVMPNEDAVITLEFEKIPETSKKVKLPESLINGKITASKTVAQPGETITLTVLPNEGYQLKEGSLKVNGTVINQTNGVYSFVMSNEDAVITLEFEKIEEKEIFNVSFNSNGGSLISPQKVEKGSKVVKPSNPTRDGYKFEGWYKDSDLTNEWNFSLDTVEKDVVIHAKWKKQSSSDSSSSGSSSGGSGGGSSNKASKPSNSDKSNKDDIVKSEEPVKPDSNNSESNNNESNNSNSSSNSNVTIDNFADAKTHWASSSIEYVTKKGLFYGTSENKFSPNQSMTRGMLVTVIYRLAGEPNIVGNDKFNDVSSEMYYSNAVKWANNNNIVKGLTENTFAPDNEVTREQIAVMLMNYAKQVGIDVSVKNDISSFKDSENVSTWAKDAIQWANANGIILGTDKNELNPKKQATRAEVATMFYNFESKFSK